MRSMRVMHDAGGAQPSHADAQSIVFRELLWRSVKIADLSLTLLDLITLLFHAMKHLLPPLSLFDRSCKNAEFQWNSSGITHTAPINAQQSSLWLRLRQWMPTELTRITFIVWSCSSATILCQFSNSPNSLPQFSHCPALTGFQRNRLIKIQKLRLGRHVQA